MKRKLTVVALCAMLFALCLPAHAQQPKNVPRIGYLSNSNPATEFARAEAIRLAKQIGLTIPPELLARASRLIK